MAKDLRNKLAVVGLTGMVFAGGIVGLSSLASADTSTVQRADATESGEVVEEAHDIDGELSVFDAYGDDDQAIILDFEECLFDSGLEGSIEGDGVSAEALEGTGFEGEALDGDAQIELMDFDEAFEECEVVLDDLSFPAGDWLELGDEWSAEDEAVFDEYDTCIEDAIGADDALDHEADLTDEDIEALDAAVEGCDEILDGLSFDLEAADVIFGGEVFGDEVLMDGEGVWIEGELDGEWIEGEFDGEIFELTEEDEALFDEFDTCLSDATGLDLDDEAEWTDENFEALEAAFETCDPILEELSDSAGFIILDTDDLDGEDVQFLDAEEAEALLDA
jgi:hypothetical protein